MKPGKPVAACAVTADLGQRARLRRPLPAGLVAIDVRAAGSTSTNGRPDGHNSRGFDVPVFSEAIIRALTRILLELSG